MPELDPVPADVIEFSPARAKPRRWLANPARSRLILAGVAAVVAIAAVVVFFGIKPGGGSSALARLIAQVTSVPVSTSNAARDGGNQVTVTPTRVTGAASPLAAGGKPEVFFVGTEFCPHCATQSWAIIVALSRFGTFTGLSTIRSVSYQLYPPLAAWTFYGSGYTSKYLAFVPVETRSNVLISRTADHDLTSSYTRLQTMTVAQQAIYRRYDKGTGVPFLDFGNKWVLAGSSFSPSVLEDQSWSQIAAALGNPRSLTGQAILGTANYITAAICALTGDQPASACTPAITSLLGRAPTASPGVLDPLPQASAAGG